MPMQMPESTSSYGSYSACASNNVQQTDSPRFHNKLYPPRPPHAPHSNQFSYVKSRREAPHHSHPHRFHSLPSIDGGNYYNNHDRMKPAPYDQRESWRLPPPSYSGKLPLSKHMSVCRKGGQRVVNVSLLALLFSGYIVNILFGFMQVQDILMKPKNLMHLVLMVALHMSQQDSQTEGGHIPLGQ